MKFVPESPIKNKSVVQYSLEYKAPKVRFGGIWFWLELNTSINRKRHIW